MKYLKKYIKFHIKFLLMIYQSGLLRTDKVFFAVLFNFQSILINSSARLSWCTRYFVVTDKLVPSFTYRIRHKQQCHLAYERGIKARVESLDKFYFLGKIGFKNGDTFIDCGANVGDLNLWFALNEISINYVGFEPSPVEYTCLKYNIKSSQVKSSQVHNLGLWKEKGDIKFYVSSQGADSSLIEPKHYDEVIISPVVRLESFVSTKIKCLKLEAEGAEPEILEGLGDKLKLVEYITADLGYERGIAEESTLVPVTNFLLTNGFELVDVCHERVCALFRNTRTLG